MTPPRGFVSRLLAKCFAGSAFDPAREDPHVLPHHPGYDLRPGVMRWLTLTFATGIGTGLSPLIPGTTGSIAGLALFWFLAPPYVRWPAYVCAVALLTATAVFACSAAEGIYGRKDDRRIAMDEVIGYLVTMLGAPHTWPAALVGFALFRFFDVVKLPPAYRLQRIRGGAGVVLDDIAAGIYACLALHLLRWLACLVA